LSEQVFLDLIGSILTVIFGVIAGFISNYFKEAKNVKQAEAVAKTVETAETQLQSKRGLAYDAVRFAEDAFKEAGGKYKLAKAINWAVDAGKAHGMDITADGIEGFVRSQYNVLKSDLQKVVPGVDDSTPAEPTDAPATDPTTVVADTAPEATADQTPVDTAGQAAPAQPDINQPTASGTAAPATGPDVQTQLSQAMAEVNAAQAKYNQMVQEVAGGQTAPV
jgi:hypothetical protein